MYQEAIISHGGGNAGESQGHNVTAETLISQLQNIEQVSITGNGERRNVIGTWGTHEIIIAHNHLVDSLLSGSISYEKVKHLLLSIEQASETCAGLIKKTGVGSVPTLGITLDRADGILQEKPGLRNLDTWTLPPIILYGPPGSGKSTIGKLLAEKEERTFLDLDTFLGETPKIQDKAQGIDNTRESEIQDKIMKICDNPRAQRAIIALTEGSLECRSNLGFINELRGRIFLLTGDADTLYKRIAIKTQTIEGFREIMEHSANHYGEFERRIEIGEKTPEQIVAEIAGYS